MIGQSSFNFDLDYFGCIGNGQYILKCDEFSEVIDAYLKPKCHSADSEAVSR